MFNKKLATGLVALTMVISSLSAPMMTSASAPKNSALHKSSLRVHTQDVKTPLKPSTLTQFPKKFDLRKDGVVTPVKFQNPWGTCWSFGGVAAAETSILSSTGQTYAQTGLDLSERHIAWFSYHPITKYDSKSQAGEGIYLTTTGTNDAFRGGWSALVTCLFASGMGPVSEKTVPYHGKNETTMYTFYADDKEGAILYIREDYTEYALSLGYSSLEEMIDEWVQENIAETGSSKYMNTEEFLLYAYNYYLNYYKDNDCYASTDDWSLSNTYKDKNGNVYSNRSRQEGYILKNGNVLPDYAITEESESAVSDVNPYGTVWKGINPDGFSAIKQELLNGRGVSVAFCADQSMPNEQGEALYMNERTWAHYTFEETISNHEVCIVGWDDTFSKDNFNSAHRPPADGAWLVKNSWGSETEYKTSKAGTSIGKQPWGIENEKGEHTGYFWISYYDKTLEEAETTEFTRAYQNTHFDTFQYDYLPAPGYDEFNSTSKLSTANIYPVTGKDSYTVSSIGVRTSQLNERVTYSVYRLKKGYTSPTDGEKIYSSSKNFEYGGYHRVELGKDEQFIVKPGETLALVATNYVIDDNGSKQYWFSAHGGVGEGYYEGQETYWKTVVNKGESFYFDQDGKWHDWADFAATARKDSNIAYDNFSLKLFATKNATTGTAKAQTVTVKNKNVTLKAAVKADKLTANTAKADITAGCKTSGNGKLTYAKKSGNSGFVVTKDGKIYAKKGTKVGTYNVVVTVKAEKTAKYNAAQKDMVLTVKVAKK